MTAASLAELTLSPRGRQAVLVGKSLEQARGAEGEPVNRGATMRPGKKDAMRTNARKTVLLGELVVAAFDVAAQYSSDPRVVSLLATRTVMRVLRRAGKIAGFGQANGLLPLLDPGQLLSIEGAGLRLGPSTSAGG